MIKQKTIKNDVTFSGIGVHSGKPVSVTLKPSEVNSGIIIKNKNFIGYDIKVGDIIPEVAVHATVIRNSKYSISTIEHLMSAIVSLEIDNIIIETQSSEIPILDGSAAPFVHQLLNVQIIEQTACKKFLTPKERLIFRGDNDRFIEIYPAKKTLSGDIDLSLYAEYAASFDHHLVGTTKLEVKVTPDYFIESIAPARTFGFLSQLSFLKQHGLAKGTSLGNTVVVGQDNFLNDQRFENEFAKHKLLDLLGDLGLLGHNLAGTIKAQKTGHSFNRLVVEHFIKNQDKWLLI